MPRRNTNSYQPVQIAILFIILLSLVSEAAMFKDRLKFYYNFIGIDWVGQYEKRFNVLKGILAAKDVVGYIADKEFEIASFFNKNLQDQDIDIESIAGYVLAQYAFSPVIIDNSVNYDFILGNFHEPVNIDEFCAKNSLVLSKDFGGGVMLFRREFP